MIIHLFISILIVLFILVKNEQKTKRSNHPRFLQKKLKKRALKTLKKVAV